MAEKLMTIEAKIESVETEKAGLEAKAAAIEKKKPDTHTTDVEWLSLQPRITAKENRLVELEKKENLLLTEQASNLVHQGMLVFWSFLLRHAEKERKRKRRKRKE